MCHIHLLSVLPYNLNKRYKYIKFQEKLIFFMLLKITENNLLTKLIYFMYIDYMILYRIILFTNYTNDL